MPIKDFEDMARAMGYVDDKSNQQLEQTEAGHKPEAPFDVGHGITVLEWKVQSGRHYQFKGTKIESDGSEYQKGEYILQNPAEDYAQAHRKDAGRTGRITLDGLGYNFWVDKYNEARGLS